MAIQIQGNGGTVQEVGGTTFRAGNVQIKPVEYGALGSYRFSVLTGTLAAALAAGTGTAGHVFAARWTDATRLAVITRLRTRFMPLTPFTTSTLSDHTSFDAFILRSYSGSHSGGTALTLTGNSFKMRTSMGTTLFGDIRIATTAALTNGTHTFDPHAFATTLRKGNRINPTATTEEVIQPTDTEISLDFNTANGEHPIVLAQNEGICIRNRTVWPAAGTGILTVDMAWAEVTAY